MYTVKLHSQKFISWRDIAKVYPLTNKINVVLIKPKLSVNFINQQDQPVPKEKAVALSRLTSSQISASVSLLCAILYTLYMDFFLNFCGSNISLAIFFLFCVHTYLHDEKYLVCTNTFLQEMNNDFYQVESSKLCLIKACLLENSCFENLFVQIIWSLHDEKRIQILFQFRDSVWF